MQSKWTRGEKWLWATPLIFIIGAGVAVWGPQVVRKGLGRPIVLDVAPGSKIDSLTLSADGSMLAVTTAESYAPKTNGGTLYFWDAHTLKPIVPWGNNSNAQLNNSPAFRTENRALMLSSDAKSIGFARVNLLKRGLVASYKLFDTATGRVRWQITGNYVFTEAHLSPDGAMLGLTEINNVGTVYRFLRATDGVEVTHFVNEGITSDNADFAWMPDSKSIVCLGYKPGLFPRSRNTAEYEQEIKTQQFFFETRRLKDGKKLQSWKTRPVLSFDLSPDGQSLVAVTGDRNNIGFENVQTTLFDRAGGRQFWTFKGLKYDSDTYFHPLSLKFAPGGKTVAFLIAGFSQTVALLDVQSGVRQRTFNLGEQNNYSRNSLVFSPDGKRLYARGKNAVLVWDLD